MDSLVGRGEPAGGGVVGAVMMILDARPRFAHLCPGTRCSVCKFIGWASVAPGTRLRVEKLTRRVRKQARKTLAAGERKAYKGECPG